MKTRSIARGIVGSVAALLGVMAAGCSADVAPGDESAEVGSTEQALNQSLAVGYTAQWPAFLKISNSQILVVGGVDGSPAEVRTTKIYDRSTDSWTAKDDLPSGSQRQKAMLAKIPGTSKYLLAGGIKAGVVLNDSLIFDPSAAAGSQWTKVTGSNMVQARFATDLVPCGTGSKLLAIGGATSTALSAATTNSVEFFSYNSGTPASSTWAALQDNSTPTTSDVTLVDARGFHGVLPVSNTDIRVFGGLATGAGPLHTVEKIVVSNSCDAAVPSTLNDMKVGSTFYERAKFGFGLISETVSGVTYDVLVAGGTSDNNGTQPTSVLRYDINTDAWNDTASAIPTARLFPVAVQHGTNDVAFVGGVTPNSPITTDFQNTTSAYNLYTSGSGWTTPNTTAPEKQLATDRVGHFAAMLNNNGGTPSLTAGMGASYSAGAATVRNSVE